MLARLQTNHRREDDISGADEQRESHKAQSNNVSWF